jgi:hypothetical protein
MRDTAFAGRDTSPIQGACKTLARRCLRTVTPFPDLTYDDLLNLIAPEEKHVFLRGVRHHAALGRYDAATTGFLSIDGDSIFTLKINGNDRDAPLIPRQAKIQESWFNGSEKAEQFKRHLRERIEVLQDWGRVLTVFNGLNDICTTPAQVRYMWPSVLALLDVAGLDDLRSKIAPFKVPGTGSLPPCPLPLRVAIKKSSTTIAMASLLPKLEDQEPPEQNVTIEIQQQSTKFHDEGLYMDMITL